MNIAELIARLQQGGNPNNAVVDAAEPRSQSELPYVDPNMAGSAMASNSARMPPVPQTPTVPPNNAPQGTPTPFTNPQTSANAPSITQSPPDLSNMYLELMRKNQNAQALDSGLTLIAAGLSKYPETRSALIQGASKESSQHVTAQDIAAMTKLQQEQQNLLLRKASLAGLMKHYNLDPAAVQYLEATGKLDEVIKHHETQNLVQVTHPDGTMTFNNPMTGKPITDIPGEPKKDVQIVDTDQGPVAVDKQEVALGTPIGGTKAPSTKIVKDDTTGAQNLVNEKTGALIAQLTPPRKPGEAISEDDDKLAAINKDRVLAGKPPATMEEYLTKIKGKGQTINIGPQGQQYPDPPPGFDYERNADGTVKIGADGKPNLYAIEGGMARVKLQEEQKKLADASLKDQRNKVQTQLASSDVGRAIDTALQLHDKAGVTGVGSRAARAVGGPGGMPWDNFDEAVRTIKSNLTIDELNRMRQNSPTGGALGNVSDFEDKMLGSVRASLAHYQGTDTVRKNLIRVKAAMELLADDNFNHDPEKFNAALSKREVELDNQYIQSKNKDSGIRRIK